MLFKLLHTLDAVTKLPVARAHCDIPCKVYDPIVAQIAALSVVRLMDIMSEVADGGAIDLAAQNTISRCVAQKEEEAEKLKQEVRVIWGDYFKQPQIDAFPEIHELVHSIMQQSSACKQGINRADGEALVEKVNRFAEIYWQTKGIDTALHPCPYPPNLPTIYPVRS